MLEKTESYLLHSAQHNACSQENGNMSFFNYTIHITN